MMGVSIEQWRGSIERFNSFKCNLRTQSDRCKHFLILEHIICYFAYLENLGFAFSLIRNIILLFGFCFMTVVLLMLALLVLLGFWTLCPDSFFSYGNVSFALYMIFSLPKSISLLFRNFAFMARSMKINIAFLLLVVSLLLIMAGISLDWVLSGRI